MDGITTCYSTTRYGNDNTTAVTIEETLALIARIEHETPVMLMMRSAFTKLQERYPQRATKMLHCGRVSSSWIDGQPVEIYESRRDMGKRLCDLMEQGRKVIWVYDESDKRWEE